MFYKQRVLANFWGRKEDALFIKHKYAQDDYNGNELI